MSDHWTVNTLPAGQYKLEIWGPLKANMALEVKQGCIVLAYLGAAHQVPVALPRGNHSDLSPVMARELSFTLLVAVPLEPD